MSPLRIVDRAGRAAGSGFHSAFATTFATEFAAFEELLVPQLMAVGCRNIGLVCDARMATLALSDGSALPRHLGRAYGLYSPPVSQGLFHPKIILQLGRDRGRAFISSANLTAAGLGGNVEIGAEIECTAEPSAERALVRAVAAYVNAGVVEPGAVRDALDWAWARTPWLEAGDDPESEDTALLTSPGDPGLLRTFVERVSDPVERLWVLSPYWDASLAALRGLSASLSPARITVLIDSRNHEFPTEADLPPQADLIDIAEWRPKRFTHAKLILAQTARHDHLLFGSANCTIPALGDGVSGGRNAEASLYRRLPAGHGLETLGLDQWRDAPAITPEALPDRVATPSIPLAALAASSPGRFAVEHGLLVWTAPPSLQRQDVVILVHDADLSVLAEISHNAEGADRRHLVAPPSVSEQGRFAAVRHVGGVSSLAGIEHPAALRRTRREPLGGAAARAADWFSHTVDLNLFALEALDALCRADAQAVSTDRIASNRSAGEAFEATTPNRTLSYDDFMRERPRDRVQAALSDSSLEGHHCDHVRQLLNRLSDFDDGAEDDAADWDLETSAAPDSAQHAGPRRPDEQRVNAAAFEKAVHSYAGTCAVGGPIGAFEILRLRLWLMLLLYNARCATLPRGLSASLDDRGWPRLILRVLSAFFSGRDAPIGRLLVERNGTSLPTDFLETWATVLWALDAVERYCPETTAGKLFLGFVEKLRARIGSSLKLDAADLDSPIYRDRRIGLDRQLGLRLDENRKEARGTSS